VNGASNSSESALPARSGSGKRRRWGPTNLRLIFRRPGTFVRFYRWPLGLLVVGSVLDTATTMSVMYRFGVDCEMHPAMWLMARLFGVTFGVPLGTVARLAFVLGIASLRRAWCGWILLLCGALYCLAAASNHFGWL
jgi:hypothetical protein